MYPYFNQGKWVSPLTYSQLKFDSVVGGGAYDQWMINPKYGFFKTKKNFLNHKSQQYIVIESMEETPLNKLSPFLIEKVIINGANPKSIRNGNLLVKVTEKTCWQSTKNGKVP